MPSKKRLTAYNEALKQYNLGNPNFSFVKKGTKEYDEVKAIETRIKEERAKDNVKDNNE